MHLTQTNKISETMEPNQPQNIWENTINVLKWSRPGVGNLSAKGVYAGF